MTKLVCATTLAAVTASAAICPAAAALYHHCLIFGAQYAAAPFTRQTLPDNTDE
jgi:hypothetical protein